MGLFGNFLENIFPKIFNKKEEIDDFLGSYHNLSTKQIGYILEVIDREIKVSAKFGLKITPEHEKIEKHVIMVIFNEYGSTLNQRGKIYSGDQYSEMMQYLTQTVCIALKKEIDYYFDKTPEGETKNKYNCHLHSVITCLARDFMEEKCTPYMA